MGKKMFVGGLPYDVTESQLSAMFSACGQVLSAKVIKDRDTGLSKGFGFVEMGSDAEAAAAIATLNNSSVGSRRIIVNEARPMEPRTGAPGGARPGGFSPRPGGFGGKPSFADKPGFGDKISFGDKPSFGGDKPGYGDKRGGRGGRGDKRGDKRGGFDEKRGGFGGKKGGGKKGKDRHDDGGDSW